MEENYFNKYKKRMNKEKTSEIKQATHCGKLKNLEEGFNAEQLIKEYNIKINLLQQKNLELQNRIEKLENYLNIESD